MHNQEIDNFGLIDRIKERALAQKSGSSPVQKNLTSWNETIPANLPKYKGGDTTSFLKPLRLYFREKTFHPPGSWGNIELTSRPDIIELISNHIKKAGSIRSGVNWKTNYEGPIKSLLWKYFKRTPDVVKLWSNLDAIHEMTDKSDRQVNESKTKVGGLVKDAGKLLGSSNPTARILGFNPKYETKVGKNLGKVTKITGSPEVWGAAATLAGGASALKNGGGLGASIGDIEKNIPNETPKEQQLKASFDLKNPVVIASIVGVLVIFIAIIFKK